jgi:hypothetical protein
MMMSLQQQGFHWTTCHNFAIIANINTSYGDAITKIIIGQH